MIIDGIFMKKLNIANGRLKFNNSVLGQISKSKNPIKAIDI